MRIAAACALKHGSYHERKRLGVGESMMWGDYFLVGNLARVSRQSKTPEQPKTPLTPEV